MEFLILFALIGIIVILALLFNEVEKIVDNTMQIGLFLEKQDRRESIFARNLNKYMKRKEKK